MDCDLYLSILKRRLASDSSALLSLNRVVVAHIVECLESAANQNADAVLALERYACDCKETCSEEHQREYYCGNAAREALAGRKKDE